MIEIYTDGSCKPNPGPGGWAARIIDYKEIWEIAGFDPDTTNNRMELTAIIKALSYIRTILPITVYTDSLYVLNPIQLGWLWRWEENKWRHIINADLWHELLDIIKRNCIMFEKVIAHSGNIHNEWADKMAKLQIEQEKGC